MKILVAGVTGYIGTALARHLHEQGHEVTGLARASSGVTNVPGGIALARPPAWSLDSLATAMAGMDAVVVLVGRQGGDEAAPGVLRADNLDPIRAIADAAAGVAGRIVLVSSVRVYGVNRPTPIDERTAIRPATEYGRLKAEAESLVESCGTPSVILRLSEVYGPGDSRSMIHRTLELLRRRPPVWPGSGKNRIHPCYLDDAVVGIGLAATLPQSHGTYVLAGEGPIVMKDLLSLGAQLLNIPPPRIHLPRPALKVAAWMGGLASRVGLPAPITRSQVETLTDDRWYDLSRIRGELGYQPRTSVAEGLARMVQSGGEQAFHRRGE